MASRENPIDDSALPLLNWFHETHPGKNEAWLAEEILNITQGRLTNWKRRGVPHAERPKIAKIIGAELSEDAIRVAVDWMMLADELREQWAAGIHAAASKTRQMGPRASDARVASRIDPAPKPGKSNVEQQTGGKKNKRR